jgi:Tfp pilus assembly protein PilP
MKGAQKGIEMKLIQILALATAMATVATAQNSGANSQPTPSPTPAAAGKTAGTKKPAAKKAASSDKKSGAKAAPGTAAKTSSNNAASPKADPSPKTGASSAATRKPAVKMTTEPVKTKTTAGTQSKGAPTPVVAAKDGNNSNAAKKIETKKTGTKKAPPAKAPAVIAVKPVAPVKKASGSQTKSSAKPGVQVPAKAPATGTAQKTAPAQTAEKPKPSVRSFGAHGRRDPFVSPIVSKDGISRPAPNCTSGKRCLVIPELVLQGTVKDTSGKMMAVVANSIKKTYFLRENDQVFQGSVEKITSDSIIFREFVKDALGRETAREVVKKLVPPS